ncbi:MAG TPA: hypothetical protein VM432_10600 [Bdellovibrionales bacterium]|nr:hypothetical protein [Bdellovibrionales bacterium]
MLIQDLTSTFSDIVQRTYAFFDQLGLSITGLLIVGALFALALIFAVREAATWFFKIDDVKKDLRRVRDSLNEIEGELRALQTIMAKNRERFEKSEDDLVDSPESEPAAVEPAPKKSTTFPVVH